MIHFLCLIGLLASTWARPAAPSAPAGPVLEYQARTDLKADIPPPQTPPVGPAGSVVRDPVTGARILRVSDAGTLPSGTSLHTDASSKQNEWNSDGTRFYLAAAGGQGTLLFDFDAAAFKARPAGVNLGRAPYGLQAIQFSFVDPNVVYGWSIGLNPRVREGTLEKRGQAKDLADPASCLKEPPRSFGLDLDVSADDRRFLGSLGPGQDRDPFLYLYDRKLGCRWYNTETGEVGGNWGEKGTVSTSERFLVHDARISLSGDYAVVVPASRPYMVVWQISTLKVSLCSATGSSPCGGHFGLGYSHVIDQSGSNDPMDVLIRPLSDLTASRHLVTHFPPEAAWPAKHWSWNNDNPQDTAPVCGATFLQDNPDTPGAPLHITRAWDNEIVCVRTDGKASTVWRFAHTFSSVRNSFWSTPRGNISRDGRFYLFTSDWMNTLGEAPNGKGRRTDGFVVELK